MRAMIAVALGMLAAPAGEAQTVRGPAMCFPPGYDRAKLDALKAADFEIADDAARQVFAKMMVSCLASPDPELRDGIAFEAFAHMARGKQLTPATMTGIVMELQVRMESRDAAGFQAPFAALVLAEMARADRIEAYLTQAQLDALVTRAAAYVSGVGDYRGFDAKEGWRHGVAHGADLLMQLALNPRVGREGLLAIREAVERQVAPKGHAYVFGEGERLARPILYAARRALISEAEWTAWLAKVAGPGDLGAWDKAFASADGLARVHDVKAFVFALWASVSLAGNAGDAVLKPGLEAAIRELP